MSPKMAFSSVLSCQKPYQSSAMSPMHWIASGGGIGRFPYAPGTVASLVAALIGAAALWLDHRVLTMLAILTCIVGTWAVHETKEMDDPGWIVIDEFAGQ